MEMVLLLIPKEKYIRVNGMRIKPMEKELTFILMELNI